MIKANHCAILLLSLLPASALAQTRPSDKRNVEDVVTGPATDFNIKKKEIPPELLKHLDNPYDLATIHTCNDIAQAVSELDRALGPDFDAVAAEETKGEKREQAALGVASGAVKSVVPFRFVVREVSGASKTQKAYRAAILSGAVRRGYLKGYAKARRCEAP